MIDMIDIEGLIQGILIIGLLIVALPILAYFVTKATTIGYYSVKRNVNCEQQNNNNLSNKESSNVETKEEETEKET